MTTATFAPTAKTFQAAPAVEAMATPAPHQALTAETQPRDTTAEPEARAFYIVTGLLTGLMAFLAIESIISTVYFFTVVYTSW